MSLTLLGCGADDDTAAVKTSDVVVLNNDNFEHDTQAVTGATTGDWLVEFYAPWCGHCKKLQPIWDEVSTELKGRVNVAKVDVPANAQLGKRFSIKGFPTIKLFSQGTMYSWPSGAQAKEWPRSKEKIIEFATSAYADVGEGVPCPDVPNLADEIKQAAKGMAKGVLFYVKHPQKIKENELGFMVAGMLIGGVVASFVFMMWSMFFAGETLPMPAKTKDE